MPRIIPAQDHVRLRPRHEYSLQVHDYADARRSRLAHPLELPLVQSRRNLPCRVVEGAAKEASISFSLKIEATPELATEEEGSVIGSG